MNSNKSAPLHAEVKEGRIEVVIGIETLVFCSRPENGGPESLAEACDEKICVVDGRRARSWAQDVVNEMLREDEVGNSPLTEFLDEMMVAAAERGSVAMLYKRKAK